jgi:hypothetical protein
MSLVFFFFFFFFWKLTWSPGTAPVVLSNTTKTERVEFSIADVDAGTQTNCTVNLLNQNLTASWYGMPCGMDFRWSISWGYNSDADSAVMTVC